MMVLYGNLYQHRIRLVMSDKHVAINIMSGLADSKKLSALMWMC